MKPLSKFWIFALALLGVGCGVSNSVMSLGVHLWSVYVLCALISQKRAQLASGGLASTVKRDLAFWVGLLYCAFTLTFFLVMAPADSWGREFGAWLLFLYWIFSLSDSPLFLEPKRLLKVDIAVGIAHIILWGICFNQKYILELIRVEGIHHNPNRLAFAVLPALIYFGERLVRGAYRERRSYTVGFFALWALLFHIELMTHTRSVLPFIIIYSVSFVWRYIHGRGLRVSKTLLWAGAIAAVVVVLIVLSRSEAAARFSFGKIFADSNVRSRLEIWRLNIEMFKESPIWGTGFRQNLVNVAEHARLRRYMSLDGRAFLAHNTYIQVLTESGVIGITLFLTVLISAFVQRSYTRWFIFSILLIGIVDTSIHLARTMPAMIFFVTLMAFAYKEKLGEADVSRA